MKVNYNVSAMIANNALRRNDNLLSDSLERLSSGLKIANAKDNPSGLAMSKRMNAQIEGLGVAGNTSNDAISIVQVADGSLTEIHDILQRMSQLSIQASNGTLTDGDRAIIQEEVTLLKDEIERMAATTQFNGQNILDGSFDYKGYVTTYGPKAISDTETVIDKITDADIKVVNYSDKVDAGQYKITGINVSYLNVTGPTGVDKRAIYFNDTYEIEYVPEYEKDSSGAYVLDANGDKIPKKDENGEIIYELDEKGNKIPKMDNNGKPIMALDDNGDPILVKEAKSEIEVYRITADGKQEKYMTNGRQINVHDDVLTISDATGKEISIQINKTFNGMVNLELTGNGGMTMQIGANEGQTLDIRIPKVGLTTLGLYNTDVSTYDGAREAIEDIKDALSTISSIRSRLGAYQNRLEHTSSSIDITVENMTAAYSRIMDVDMAEEMTVYSTQQVLSQAGISMMAQANERPSQILQLLQ